MIIDAHCHAWAQWPYDPPVPDPDSRGRVEQLLWEMDRCGVGRAVVICAGLRGNLDNNDYVFAASRVYGDRLVTFVDVDSRWSPTHHSPGAPDRFRQALDRYRPLGVTHYIDEQASAEWLLGEEGSACLRLLAERGVILSLACGALQVPVVARAAASHPELTVLVHHMGRPKSGSVGMLSAVLAGAAAPNVFVKISGFGYGVDEGWDFPYPTMQETARALHDAFRADRLCWGSDYPVVCRFMTYAQSLEIVRSHCGFFSTQEREQVLGATMARLLARAAERRGMHP